MEREARAVGKDGVSDGGDRRELEGKVTPHTLRHTAATWLMQNGVPMWEAAGFLGMSKEILEKTYGHHHPDHMKAAALGFRKRFSGDNGGDGRAAKT